MLRDKHTTNHIRALGTDVTQQRKSCIAQKIIELKQCTADSRERKRHLLELYQKLFGYDAIINIQTGTLEIKQDARFIILSLSKNPLLSEPPYVVDCNDYRAYHLQFYWVMHCQQRRQLLDLLHKFLFPEMFV